MDSNELRPPKQRKQKKGSEKRKISGEKKASNPQKRPPRAFKDCKLHDFFLTDKILRDQDLQDLEGSIKYWGFQKSLKNLQDFFKYQDRLEKNLKIAHIVIQKFLDDDIKPSLFQAYLEILAKNSQKVQELCQLNQIKKLEKQIHDDDFPYFCSAFSIKISDKMVEKLLKEYAENGIFQSGFKLIEVTGSTKNIKRIDILVDGAKRSQLKDLIPFLLKFGYTKNDYPDINDELLTDSAFYFLKKEGYDYAEEILRPHPAVLAKIVDSMLWNKKEKTIMEALSVCKRNPQIFKYLKNPQKVQKQLAALKQYIPNPLQVDAFGPSNSQQFLSFSDYGLTKNQVLFLHEDHPSIEKTLQKLFSSQTIGIDTQSLVGRTKFDSDLDLVATLQIANSTEAYVLDPKKANKPNIVKYLNDFVQNPDKTIVGHTVDDDLKLLLGSFGINKWKCKVVELKDLFDILYPEERKGLANMCHVVLGKPICKKYTLTDWGRRPLLQNQIHYAAMDAFIVIILYKKMQELLLQRENQKKEKELEKKENEIRNDQQ